MKKHTLESPTCPTPQEEGTLIAEAQLILAEKRTALATMRTGIAILALPLSIVGLLVATSGHYDPTSVEHLLIPLLLICFALACFGIYLLIRSMVRIHKHDRLILHLKRANPRLRDLIDIA